MKKEFLFTAICLATCLLSCSSNSDEYINNLPSYNRDVTNINMQTDEEIIEGDASHQFLASLLYTKLITTIGKPSKDIPMAVSYPDYFGGAFTDEGKIKSTDFCEVIEDQNGLIVNIQHMILASFSCDEGDSGRVVYTYFSAQNKRYTTGILKGYVYYDTWGIYASVFTSAITALSMLHLERY